MTPSLSEIKDGGRTLADLHDEAKTLMTPAQQKPEAKLAAYEAPVGDGEVEGFATSLELTASMVERGEPLPPSVEVARLRYGAVLLRRLSATIAQREGEIAKLREAIRFAVGSAINELVSRGLPTEWSPEAGIGVGLAALGCASTSLDDDARAALSGEEGA